MMDLATQMLSITEMTQERRKWRETMTGSDEFGQAIVTSRLAINLGLFVSRESFILIETSMLRLFLIFRKN